MSWWMPVDPVPSDEPERPGEGKVYCTICIYTRSLLVPATISCKRATTEPGTQYAPVWYCAAHAVHAPLDGFLVNAARHAYDAGEDPDLELPAELLGALLA